MRRRIEWEGKRKKEEIEESQMEEEWSIQTVNNKEDLKK